LALADAHERPLVRGSLKSIRGQIAGLSVTGQASANSITSQRRFEGQIAGHALGPWHVTGQTEQDYTGTFCLLFGLYC
jgi:hypothetical protein